MPAFRSKRYACAFREEHVKVPKPRQPKKILTEEEKADAELEKISRKMAREDKKEWEATLVPWVAKDNFRFLVGTMALYKSDAKSAYSITEKEILTLPHESIPGSAKTFFAQEDVKNLSRRKFLARAHKPDVLFDTVKGELRLFKKTDNSNRSRRKNFEAQSLNYAYLNPSYHPYNCRQ